MPENKKGLGLPVQHDSNENDALSRNPAFQKELEKVLKERREKEILYSPYGSNALFRQDSTKSVSGGITMEDIDESLKKIDAEEIANLEVLIESTLRDVKEYESKKEENGKTNSQIYKKVGQFSSQLNQLKDSLIDRSKTPENHKKEFILFVKSLAGFRTKRIEETGKQSRTVGHLLVNTINNFEKKFKKTDEFQSIVLPFKSKLKEWINRLVKNAINKVQNRGNSPQITRL